MTIKKIIKKIVLKVLYKLDKPQIELVLYLISEIRIKFNSLNSILNKLLLSKEGQLQRYEKAYDLISFNNSDSLIQLLENTSKLDPEILVSLIDFVKLMQTKDHKLELLDNLNKLLKKDPTVFKNLFQFFLFLEDTKHDNLVEFCDKVLNINQNEFLNLFSHQTSPAQINHLIKQYETRENLRQLIYFAEKSNDKNIKYYLDFFTFIESHPLKDSAIDLLSKLTLTYPFYFNYQSYAQEGEDLVLHEFLRDTEKGFYVDIGAHHPFRFSNTMFFYNLGWSGINVDPCIGMKVEFDKHRPKDINLEIGISAESGTLDFYILSDPALNTFDKQRVDYLLSNTNYKLIETKKISVEPLVNIFSQYCADRKIDFLSVDVEGLELSVLSSNDWTAFRPRFLLIEILGFELENKENNIHQFLAKNGYHIVAKTLRTVFYKDNTL